MRTTIKLFLISILLLTIGCNGPESKIKENLKSRFTGFEIVKIKQDSCSIKTAKWTIMSLRIRVSEAGAKISKGLYDIEVGSAPKLETFKTIDSIYNKAIEECSDFEKTRFSYPDKCYYVKYLVYKEELKIPREEYFYINEQNGEVLHRSCDWQEFLLDEKYDEIVKNGTQFTVDLMNLRYKLTGKF